MRKDYIEASSALAEDAFVAESWDRVWDERGLAAARGTALRRTEEYAFLRAHVLSVPAGLDVLDCGCGTGDWTLLLREEGHRVVGIDIAARTIQKLSEAHGGAFQVADFRRTGLEAESFDLVINWGGLEHFEEGPAAGIKEAWRLLRPGGVFVATTPFHNLRVRMLDRWRGEDARTAGPEVRFYQYRFTRAELESHFRGQGFAPIVSRIMSGTQGMTRALDHELGWLGRRLPEFARALVVLAGGRIFRRWVGHMVLCMGVKPPRT